MPPSQGGRRRFESGRPLQSHWGRKGSERRADLTPVARKATFVNLPPRIRMRRLNEANTERAMVAPEKYRSEERPIVDPRDGRLELEFLPFEVLTMDRA